MKDVKLVNSLLIYMHLKVNFIFIPHALVYIKFCIDLGTYTYRVSEREIGTKNYRQVGIGLNITLIAYMVSIKSAAHQ